MHVFHSVYTYICMKLTHQYTKPDKDDEFYSRYSINNQSYLASHAVWLGFKLGFGFTIGVMLASLLLSALAALLIYALPQLTITEDGFLASILFGG